MTAAGESPDVAWWASDELTLRQAVDAARPFLTSRAVGLVATTARYGFVRSEPDGLRWPDRPVDLAEVFDLRLFDAGAELRWVHEQDGRGRAVVLGEVPSLAAGRHGAFDWRLRTQSVVGRQEQTMLLWGTRCIDATAGWLRLSEARIGELRIPFDAGPPDLEHGEMVLRLVEYVAEGVDGNAYLFAERLTGIDTRSREPMDRDERSVEGES